MKQANKPFHEIIILAFQTASMNHAVDVRQNLRRQFTKEDSHRPFDFYSKTASLLFTVQLISAHDPSA